MAEQKGNQGSGNVAALVKQFSVSEDDDQAKTTKSRPSFVKHQGSATELLAPSAGSILTSSTQHPVCKPTTGIKKKLEKKDKTLGQVIDNPALDDATYVEEEYIGSPTEIYDSVFDTGAAGQGKSKQREQLSSAAQLEVANVTLGHCESALRASWDAPIEGKELKYFVMLYCDGEEVGETPFKTSSTSITFTDIQSSKRYHCEVMAYGFQSGGRVSNVIATTSYGWGPFAASVCESPTRASFSMVHASPPPTQYLDTPQPPHLSLALPLSATAPASADIKPLIPASPFETPQQRINLPSLCTESPLPVESSDQLYLANTQPSTFATSSPLPTIASAAISDLEPPLAAPTCISQARVSISEVCAPPSPTQSQGLTQQSRLDQALPPSTTTRANAGLDPPLAASLGDPPRRASFPRRRTPPPLPPRRRSVRVDQAKRPLTTTPASAGLEPSFPASSFETTPQQRMSISSPSTQPPSPVKSPNFLHLTKTQPPTSAWSPPTPISTNEELNKVKMPLDEPIEVEDNPKNVIISANKVTHLSGHGDKVICCSWNPKCDLLASCSDDSSARLWNLKADVGKGASPSGPVLWHNTEKRNCNSVRTLDWNRDGTLLATGSGDGSVGIWTKDGNLSHHLTQHSGPISALKWNKQGNYIVSGSCDKTAIIWDVQSGEQKQQFCFHGDDVNDVDWRDNDCFASCSIDGNIHVCRLGCEDPVKTFKGQSGSVHAVEWDPSMNFLASGSDDKSVKIWSMTRDDLVHNLRGHSSTVSKIRWNQNLLLASASWDKTVFLWEPERGICLQTLERHQDLVSAIAFSPDGRLLASGSWDNCVNIWNTQSGQLVRSYQGSKEMRDVDWNAAGTKVGAVGYDGTVIVLDLRKTMRTGTAPTSGEKICYKIDI